MDILPKLLYLFQVVHVRLPKACFEKLWSISSRVIWHHSQHRIKFSVLRFQKTDGGTDLPDFLLYYRMALITRVLDSFHGAPDKQGVDIEATFLDRNLRALPWLGNAIILAVQEISPLTGATLTAMSSLLTSPSISTTPGSLTPLLHNLAFLPSLDGRGFGTWDRQFWPQIRRIITYDGVLPSLYDNCGFKGSVWFLQLQILSFYIHLSKTVDLHHPLTAFESCYVQDFPSSCVI